MTEDAHASRRAFLKRTAKTAVYVAPVIRTLVAPQRASAQLSGKGMMMGMMIMNNMGMGFMKGLKLMATAPAGPVAPWVPVPRRD
jgi:hypothetical protein